MLTSVDNFWRVHVDGPTFPWKVVASDVPVWTQSGHVKTNRLDKDGTLIHTLNCSMSNKSIDRVAIIESVHVHSVMCQGWWWRISPTTAALARLHQLLNLPQSTRHSGGDC
jgi:hypothetical protein